MGKLISFKDLETSPSDDFVYQKFIHILQNIRLVQGGSALDATLHRHPRVLNYCKAKQLAQLNEVESSYFYDDGTLNSSALDEFRQNKIDSLKSRGFTL